MKPQPLHPSPHPPSLILHFSLNILRHAARFTVLLIRQRQLVSKDTLYINFGYCRGWLTRASFLRHRRSTPARLASFVVLRFWLLEERGGRTPHRQWTARGGVVFWHIPRTFRGWQARRGMSYWRRSRRDLKRWYGMISLDVKPTCLNMLFRDIVWQILHKMFVQKYKWWHKLLILFIETKIVFNNY